MGIDLPFVIAAAGHPSLDGAVARFSSSQTWDTACRLEAEGAAIRLAAVRDGEVIGLARIDLAGPHRAELFVAVAAPWRGSGIATALGRAVSARAEALSRSVSPHKSPGTCAVTQSKAGWAQVVPGC